MMRADRTTGTLGLVALISVLAGGCTGEDDLTPGTGGAAGLGGTGTGAASTTGGTAGTGGAPATGGTMPACLSDGQIVISDATNYSFSSTLNIQTQTVKDATDLVFDWTAVTQDFYGRPMSASEDTDLALVSLWGMTEAELTTTMNADSLNLQANKGALTAYMEELGTPAPTSINLLSFNSFRSVIEEYEIWRRFDTTPLDPPFVQRVPPTTTYEFPQDTHTFMFTISDGTTAGKHVRMITFFKLDPTATATTVVLTNSSTTMQHQVHLANLPPYPVPTQTPALTVDWSQMTVNAIGNPYAGDQITEAVVAHYATSTLEQLEERFLYLEDEATEWYSGEVLSGRSINLGALANASGATFPGIDGTGVWLVALFCATNCNNPAPWSITVLKPCG
ncbi:MAG: hypothetical protein JW751_00815 [Polyangiaceae bacterium]|nr:hypothetical protein [Polyangiaceae bacterium]